MDISPPTTRTTQTKNPRVDKGEKEDRGKAHSTHRSTRYKEKYQTMRERFERVNAAKETYQRDLQLANEKIRKIQEENDLLLDAMLAASPLPLNSGAPNSKYYQSSHSSQPVVPPQGFAPSQTQYQSAPAHQYHPRADHSDHPPHSHSHSHSQPQRQYQYPLYGANEGREVLTEQGHHYPGSIATSRSRGLPPDVGYRS